MARTQVTGKQVADGANGIDLTVDVTNTLPLANGGTAATTAADARTSLGLGTAAVAAGPSGAIVGTTDAQTLTGKTIDGASNTIVNVAGMLLPVQGATMGAETYTIASGSVSQINGTAIAGYSPSIGDRILIATAPAASGTSSSFNLSNQPANGVYRVTGNTTNLTLARASDMSGSLLPFGLSVYVENSNWNAGTIYTVSSVGTSFTYGTTAMQWLGTGGSNLNVSTVFISDSGSVPLGFWNGSNSVYVKPTSSGAAATITLPNATGTLALVKPRDVTTTQSATPAINTDVTDQATITALAQAITSMTTNLTGTPANGQKLTIRIKDNGTARAIALGSSFRALGATLPTTTVVSKTLYLGCIYNGADTVWDVVAVAQEA